jgi:hypothetical protein
VNDLRLLDQTRQPPVTSDLLSLGTSYSNNRNACASSQACGMTVSVIKGVTKSWHSRAKHGYVVSR